MADMSTYLSNKTADYTATEMTLTPQKAMNEIGQKKQYYHEFDDGTMEVVAASGTYFIVTMTWNYLSNTDAATLLDFWHDTSKANGRKNSFYLLHPVDGNTYTAKFITPITYIETVEFTSGKQVPTIKFLVNGVKP